METLTMHDFTHAQSLAVVGLLLLLAVCSGLLGYLLGHMQGRRR